jgi:hypothetical protein
MVVSFFLLGLWLSRLMGEVTLISKIYALFAFWAMVSGVSIYIYIYIVERGAIVSLFN